jgi:hypothetical protein
MLREAEESQKEFISEIQKEKKSVRLKLFLSWKKYVPIPPRFYIFSLTLWNLFLKIKWAKRQRWLYVTLMDL